MRQVKGCEAGMRYAKGCKVGTRQVCICICMYMLG